MELNDQVFSALSQMIKPFAMVIKVRLSKTKFSYSTGFPINFGNSSNTYIMTCHHVVSKAKCIEVRKIEETEYVRAYLVYKKPAWDIAVLVIEGVSNETYAPFAEDGTISSCQTLLHVGHSDEMVWSVFVGRAVYQCVNNAAVDLNDHDTCQSYHCSSLAATPNYRVMGDVWNEAYFNANESLTFTFEKNLNPHIPVIQCAGFCCRAGCSGGPVFNCQGEILGMVVREFDGSQIAINVTMLREFVRLFSAIAQDPSEGSSRAQPKRKGLW